MDFALQGISITYVAYDAGGSILGVFTLANKVLRIPRESMSRTMERRVSKFAEPDRGEGIVLAAPIIAQLGKDDGAPRGAIDGHALMGLASGAIGRALDGIGGRVAYLECEDVPALMAFYEREGFRLVAERTTLSGSVYHVYIKFVNFRRAA